MALFLAALHMKKPNMAITIRNMPPIPRNTIGKPQRPKNEEIWAC
jgi:hypothetical protein